MGDHDTWFHLLPGYKNLERYFSESMRRDMQVIGFGENTFTITHVVISALIVVVLFLLAISYRNRLRGGTRERLVPDSTFSLRTVFDLLIEATLSIARDVMGPKNAERFLPLLGTFVFFILFNNLIGLVPGFLPATDTLKTNLALSGLVFLLTHAYGVREHGIIYFKHFLGPLPYRGALWILAPLMLVIELISHAVRPVSLAVRLMGNMFADHKLLGTMFLLIPLLLPLPFYVLGILVCIVQTLVFTLLSMIYIGEAVAHEAH